MSPHIMSVTERQILIPTLSHVSGSLVVLGSCSRLQIHFIIPLQTGLNASAAFLLTMLPPHLLHCLPILPLFCSMSHVLFHVPCSMFKMVQVPVVASYTPGHSQEEALKSVLGLSQLRKVFHLTWVSQTQKDL